MARETKVGLLAGLAFIICFAVILANRGANGPPGLANSFLPNGGLELPKLVQRNQAAANDAAANPARNRTRQPVRQPAPETTTTNAAPNVANRQASPLHAASDSAPATGAELPLATNPEPPRFVPESTIAQNTRPVDAPAVPHAGLERGSDAPISMIATNPSSSELVTAPVRPYPNETTPSAPATATPVPAVQGTPYTVKASDTLSSIASAHYGTKSRHAVEAIFQANRGVLSDIDSVKLGTVLTIPKFAGAGSEKAPPSEKTAAPTKSVPAAEKTADAKGKGTDKPSADKKTTEKESGKKATEAVADNEKNFKNFKWYQVKKNDRFASIARDQLGDAGRWQEVYELNKDKFPDPQKIREGVRIKLPPPVALATAGKEKRR